MARSFNWAASKGAERAGKGSHVRNLPSTSSQVQTILSDLPFILDANVFRDGLHVRVHDEQRMDTVRKALSATDIEISSMKKISPSMEDAFLSLIRDAAERKDTTREVGSWGTLAN